MIAKNLINDTIPPLKTTDHVQKALAWMGEFHVQHLPVIENFEYKGIISEYDILDLESAGLEALLIGQYDNLNMEKTAVYDHEHIYDILKSINESQLSLMPVLDEEDQYIGVITIESLLEYFANLSSIQDPGGIIILEMSVSDYTLTEIAQIIETNDAKILSMYVTTHKDSRSMDVTIKVNRTDLGRIISTFERYEYNVRAAYQEDDYLEDLQNHYDEFMNYLSI